MKRIDSLTADTDKHGSGKNGFQDPSAGTPTNVTFTWFDEVQEEILDVIEGAAQTPASGSGQLLNAIEYMAARRAVLNWEPCDGGSTAGAFFDDMRGGDFDPVTGYWLLAGNTDDAEISKDDGRTFAQLTTGMASTVGLEDCAFGSGSSAVCVGSSATMYQRPTVVSGSWGTVTAPGTPTTIWNIVYDTSNSRFIIVGEKAASAPYAATSDNSTGTAFTDRTSTVPAGFAGLPLYSLTVNTSGVAVAAASSAHTKLAYSSDGGLNWSESTTSVVSGVYDVAWNAGLSLFVAVRIDSYAANQAYTSADGDTWTLIASGAIGFDGTPNNTRGKGVACVGSAIVVAGERSACDAVGVSLDSGATWDVIPVVSSANAGKLIGSRTAGKVLLMTSTSGLRTPRWRAG